MARINAVSFHEVSSIEHICRTVRAAGFDSLELSRPPFYNKLTTPALRQHFTQWSQSIGLSLYGFDCWVDVNPYEHFDETLLQFRKAIDWAADLNLGMVISHDPWASVNGHRRPEACLQQSVALFRTVAEWCEARALRLVFEPHPDTLSMDNRWACDFIDSVADGRAEGVVGLLYDCCHYGVGQPGTYLDAISALGRRITHLHFSDGDQQTYALHLPLGTGCLKLDDVVEACRESGFCGTLTNDLYNYPLLESGALHNADRIREVELRLGISQPVVEKGIP